MDIETLQKLHATLSTSIANGAGVDRSPPDFFSEHGVVLLIILILMLATAVLVQTARNSVGERIFESSRKIVTGLVLFFVPIMLYVSYAAIPVDGPMNANWLHKNKASYDSLSTWAGKPVPNRLTYRAVQETLNEVGQDIRDIRRDKRLSAVSG